MKLSLAPIQGITIAAYRYYYNQVFGGFDDYYAPFISPTNIKEASFKMFQDILPNTFNNTDTTIPQLLGNNGSNFREFAKIITNAGYQELNWNIGCPFSNITRKQKGSGILPYPDLIRLFLDEVCKDTNYDLTVKMRLGFKNPDEGIAVMQCLNEYPLTNVIIHGRTGIQQYLGNVDLDSFERLYKLSKHPIAYNGDIFTLKDYLEFKERFPDINHLMLGRGAIKNPFLASTIKGNPLSSTDKIIKFHTLMYEYYLQETAGEGYCLNRMKEFWNYMHVSIDPDGHYIQEIRRSQSHLEYSKAVNDMLKLTAQSP